MDSVLVIGLGIVSSILIILTTFYKVFRKALVKPRLCFQHTFKGGIWNIEVTNQKGFFGSTASDVEAVLDIHRINENGTHYDSTDHADGMRIVWSDIRKYLVPFNQGLMRPLEVLCVDSQKTFIVRHEKTGDFSRFNEGLYTIRIELTARELRNPKTILERQIRIPDELTDLGR